MPGKAVLVSFYVDPLPAATLEATFCHSLAAAVVVYRAPAVDLHDVFAMYAAIREAGLPLDGGQGADQPGPGVAAVTITTNGDGYELARTMAHAIGATVQPVHCPSHLVADERFGLALLIRRLYDDYLQPALLAPDVVTHTTGREVTPMLNSVLGGCF
jgi:hypothetical protein